MALTDFETTIKEYIKRVLEEDYPELSTDSGTIISDLFINPMVTVLKPFINLVNRVDLVQDLSNAHLMTTEELDEIGLNNYGIPRKAGERSSGYVHAEVEAQYVTDTFVVGPVIVATSDNLRFSNNVSTIIRYLETDEIDIEGSIVPGVAADYLNPLTGKYEFPIYVEADNLGTSYNVEAGAINTLVTKYPLLTGVVTNKTAFTNGVDEETNTAYAERLKSRETVKQMGIKRGYRSHILENFDNVRNVYVVGFDDELMERDTIIARDNGLMTEKHIGGKTDLYIRGSSYNTYDQYVYVASNKIRLEYPLLSEVNSIIVSNITNPDNTGLSCTVEYEFPDTRTGWVELTITNTVLGVLPRPGDEINIKYKSYVDETLTETLWHEQTLIYESFSVILDKAPYYTVTAVYNETKDIDISLEDAYTVSRNYPIIERSVCPSQTDVELNKIKLDPNNAINITDYYKDCTIYVVDSLGNTQSRIITAYNKYNNIADIDSPWETQPDDYYTYYIRSNRNRVEGSVKDKIMLTFNSEKLVEPEGGFSVLAFESGDLIRVTYSYNTLISDIQDNMDIEDNRVITTDVLIREAVPKYLYFGFNIKCKYGKTITNTERLLISSLIEDMLLAADFEETIKLYDLIGNLYKNVEIMEFVDYVNQPCIFFSSDELITYTEQELLELNSDEYEQSTITLKNAEYPVLGMLAINVIN